MAQFKQTRKNKIGSGQIIRIGNAADCPRIKTSKKKWDKYTTIALSKTWMDKASQEKAINNLINNEKVWGGKFKNDTVTTVFPIKTGERTNLARLEVKQVTSDRSSVRLCYVKPGPSDDPITPEEVNAINGVLEAFKKYSKNTGYDCEVMDHSFDAKVPVPAKKDEEKSADTEE